MDAQHFDRLARTVTSSASRRAALAMVLGGGLAALRGEPASAAKKTCGGEKDKCKRSRDCCKGLSCRVSGRCRYNNSCGGREGDYCAKNGDCCEGFKCRKKPAECRACKDEGQRCKQKADCCPGMKCRNGRCRDVNPDATSDATSDASGTTEAAE